MAEIVYHIYQRPKVGYTVSGDAYLIRENGACLLVCLADGLGSGPVAAKAAQTAVDWVSTHVEAPLDQLICGCHEAIRHTRGAAMALVRIDTSHNGLAFIGVGNIEFYARSAAPMHPISYPGIVGSRLPSLHEFNFLLCPGDLIVLHTDGISRRYATDGVLEREAHASPQCLAETIALSYARPNDDATLIVLSFASNSNRSGIEGNYAKNFNS